MNDSSVAVSSPESVPSAAQGARHFRCPTCSGEVVFRPGADALACGYCGWSEAIPKTVEAVRERSYEAYLEEASVSKTMLAPHALQMDCKECGATLTFESTYQAGACPFCAAPWVLAPRDASPVVSPQGVVPFRLKSEQTHQCYQQWLASRWFAPSDLQKQAQREPIKGVYLPHWTYDANTLSFYTGERGDAYYETESYTERDSDGNTHHRTRQVRRIRWTHVNGVVTVYFDDLLIPAVTSIEPARLQQLEPWELKECLVDYTPAFLAGFSAQQAQVDVKSGFEQAKVRMEGSIRSAVRQDIGGDEQTIHTVKTQYSAVTFKHLLLPVYVSAYQYQKKVYQFLVNGRTGEVYGKRPYSFWKIFLFCLAMVVLIGGVCLLVWGYSQP